MNDPENTLCIDGLERTRQATAGSKPFEVNHAKHTTKWFVSIFKGTGIYSYNIKIPAFTEVVFLFSNGMLRKYSHLPA